MKRKFKRMPMWYIVGMVCVLIVTALSGCMTNTPAAGASPTEAGEPQPPAQAADPQHLLIPRWFLSGLTLDGSAVEVAPDQQAVTIQFQEDGKVNGSGGCNNFSATYSATADGKMAFGPVLSTKMACEPGMQLESAFFQALSQVEQFSTADGLVLSSADGKTSITLRMPPK